MQHLRPALSRSQVPTSITQDRLITRVTAGQDEKWEKNMGQPSWIPTLVRLVLSLLGGSFFAIITPGLQPKFNLHIAPS